MPIVLVGAWCSGALGVEVVERVDVEPVWAGHRVGFSLLTNPPHQYVAYYDAERQMSVAQRRLGEPEWEITKLPSRVGWDSHNYVTMTVDREGYLHLAGNMHCVPMIYFRSQRPRDASTLERVPYMVGPEREQRVTYPVFLRGPEGRLVFRYRDGRSGSGDDIYNAYDESTRSWSRLIDQPLTSGEGKMNAYCSRPRLGPDGRYHLVWVWRDTPDCATNHDLSYARSRDLVHWETAAGEVLRLPITPGSGAVVDPVPVHGGMINGGHRLGYDAQHRPVIAYHKYDAQGNTQIYVARFENRAWRVRQLSDWSDYRWDFSGGGSIPFEVRIGDLITTDDGLRISCKYGRGRQEWTLDADTLAPVAETELTAAERREPGGARGGKQRSRSRATNQGINATPPRPDFPGLAVRQAGDTGKSGAVDRYYQLKWYSLGSNRDRPREGPLPTPVMLRVLQYER